MSAKFYIVGFFFCLIIAQGSSGDGVNPTDAPATEAIDLPVIITTTPSEDTTTVEPSPTPTTTPKPSTTTKPSTTPTTPSTTPTTPSTTPTTPSTTPTTPSTTPSTPSTTPAPSTTTTSTTTAPSTTSIPPTTAAPPVPPPAPLPEPEVGSWALSNSSTNLTCVIMRMALRMKIPYISTVNKTLEWGQLNLAKNANLTGKCDDESIKSNITQVRLWWSNNTNYLDITFKRYDESNTFNITRLYLTQNVSGDAFPNNTVKGMVHYQGNGSGLFAVEAVPIGSSYKCSHKVSVNLSEVNASDRSAILAFSKVQLQAFVNSTSGNFGTVYDCPGMDTSDIVPIAVGCALAGLVIGVLIAYLVGRRRSHARGYLSM
ncbi:macrosialin-like [Hetaerina americana]|uniref:macrosialin-like n=1 Tax=Hetaerina americana TaxID=62018 RepID=UPI003A7F41C3